jgi:hypothetical protein
VPLLKWLFKRERVDEANTGAADLHHAAHHQELTAEDAMRKATRLIALAALVTASVSCGDVVRQGSSPVFLVIDQLQGIRGAVTPGTPGYRCCSERHHQRHRTGSVYDLQPLPDDLCDRGSVTLRTPLKDPERRRRCRRRPITRSRSTGPRRVHPRRRPQYAGRRRPVRLRQRDHRHHPGGGTLTLGFELVRNVAKQEPPLVAAEEQHNIISMTAR